MPELTRDYANSIFRIVKKKFNYVSDSKNYGVMEHWTSHAAAVKAGKEFEDDCDGFALTCAELLVDAGFPRSNVYAIICKVETGGGHLVCGVVVGEVVWILDNRYNSMYDWRAKTEYEWQLYMTFDEPGVWKMIDDGV